MNSSLETIPLTNLLIAFIPVGVLLLIMHRWRLRALTALYATGRMLVQLLAVGYVLTYVFETDQPLVIAAVVVVMVTVSAWIALRPLQATGVALYTRALVAIAGGGITVLAIVTQLVLDLDRWFEPSFVIPLGGIIFHNAMNTVSLAAERFESEQRAGADAFDARRTALDASLIPRINSLLAVGIVSLPGMMSGQILSGIDPLIAVRYQIVVMCMIFASGGLGAALFLSMISRRPIHTVSDTSGGNPATSSA
jgi:putative ABC transport system permease protein